MQNAIVSREEWLAARLALLEEEKALTRRSDELARKRQALPWVRVEKPYRFDTEDGAASLADLFRGRSQLLVYHFMFGPEFEAGCPSCSSIADGFNGYAVHLAGHDVTLCAVSLAPLDRLLAYKQRMAWTFPWASSHGGDFNFDYNVSLTQEQQHTGAGRYNFRDGSPMIDPAQLPEPIAQIAAGCGTDPLAYIRQQPGLSAFVRDGDAVFHTYSAFARGLDGLWGVYQWLDRAPKGRNETGPWLRRRDEYGATAG